MKNFLINLWAKFFGKAKNTTPVLEIATEIPAKVVTVCKCNCGNSDCKCDTNCKCVNCGCKCNKNCSCKKVKEEKKLPTKPKTKLKVKPKIKPKTKKK